MPGEGAPQRYRSIRALSDDLHRWLDGRPITARPVSLTEKAWRWCRLNPVVAALVGALVMSVSVGFLGVLVLWRRAEADFQTTSELVDQILAPIAPSGACTQETRVHASLFSSKQGSASSRSPRIDPIIPWCPVNWLW